MRGAKASRWDGGAGAPGGGCTEHVLERLEELGLLHGTPKVSSNTGCLRVAWPRDAAALTAEREYDDPPAFGQLPKSAEDIERPLGVGVEEDDRGRLDRGALAQHRQGNVDHWVAKLTRLSRQTLELRRRIGEEHDGAIFVARR